MSQRFFAIFVFLLFAAPLVACSCTGQHTPLREALCWQDTTGNYVLELVMISRSPERFSNSATFRVDQVHIGNTDIREITLSGRTSCAWYLGDDDQPGKRYLYFAYPPSADEGEGSLFTCAYNSNIYRLNPAGNQIEYATETNGLNTGLAYQPLYPTLDDYGCGDSPSPFTENPLRHLYLVDNPGNGAIRLQSLTAEYPYLQQIDVYDINGRLIKTTMHEADTPPSPIELETLVAGIYLVVVRGKEQKKTLRYVRL